MVLFVFSRRANMNAENRDQALFTTDILTYHNRKSTSVTHYVNNGCIPLSVLVWGSCYCTCWLIGTLSVTEPLLMLLITPLSKCFHWISLWIPIRSILKVLWMMVSSDKSGAFPKNQKRKDQRWKSELYLHCVNVACRGEHVQTNR